MYSAIWFSLLDMDQNKNEEHSSGGPAVNSQHHIALSLQKKVSCDEQNTGF